MKNIDALQEYKQYLIVEKGFSKNTIENYMRDIQNFVDYIHSNYLLDRIEDIEKDHIYQYIKDLNNHLTSTSIQRHVVSLRRFYVFLMKKGFIKTNVMSHFDVSKKEKHLPEVLTESEVNQLIESIKVKDVISSRNRSMLELLYAAGLRVSELCNLSLHNVNIQKRFVRCIGKGNKERIVPINTVACQYLKDYIENYRHELCKDIQTSYLFLDHQGKPISRDNFYHILQNLVKKSGLQKHVTPHTLRHTFATQLLDNNADLRAIQEMLGHSDISTTTIYTHVTNQKLIKDYKQAHPRARKKGIHE